ncbi:Coenzyme Q-binding protein COQ10 A, mitochondrial [Orchesella cincta]|uniref:Coenzyme Q-binding protein COQ10 A, mitochondrial n=1 Tax=Orchesella cincta TaxID=48709 RepID=A0A1D2M3H8_ORCCI|nr:Coenzyme Q-binding protein COQ10 A, mitochondrial [Orchesella cincta]
MIKNCIQQANFLSFPGGSSTATKRKQFTERRIMGTKSGCFKQNAHPNNLFSLQIWMEQMFDVIRCRKISRLLTVVPFVSGNVQRKRFLERKFSSGDTSFCRVIHIQRYARRPLIIKAESTKGKLFKELTFVWKFSPGLKGKPQSCIIDYNVSLEFRSTIASQAANVFFNQVVRAMTEAFYNEAKKRYGPESVPSRKIEIVGSSSNSSDDDSSGGPRRS